MDASTTANGSAAEYALRLPQVAPAVIPEDVTARKGNKAAWPILAGVSIAQVEIPVGKWRAPHYHTNTPELAVVLRGIARAGLINPKNELIVVDLQEGDCVFFPMGWTHWLRNMGKVAVQAYFNYGHEQPVTFEVGNLVTQIGVAEKEILLKGRVEYTETE